MSNTTNQVEQYMKLINEKMKFLSNSMNAIKNLFEQTTPITVPGGATQNVPFRQTIDKRVEDGKAIMEELFKSASSAESVPMRPVHEFFKDKDLYMNFSTALFDSAIKISDTINYFFDPRQSELDKNKTIEKLFKQPEKSNIIIKGLLIAFCQLEAYVGYTRKTLQEFRKVSLTYENFYTAHNKNIYAKFNPLLNTNHTVGSVVYNVNDFDNVFSATEKLLVKYLEIFQVVNFFTFNRNFSDQDLQKFATKMTTFCTPSVINHSRPPKDITSQYPDFMTPALLGYFETSEAATRTMTETQLINSMSNDKTEFQTGSIQDVVRFLDEGIKSNLWGFGNDETIDIFGGRVDATESRLIAKNRPELEKIAEVKMSNLLKAMSQFQELYKKFDSTKGKMQRTPEQYTEDELKVLKSVSSILSQIVAELEKYDAHMKKYFTSEEVGEFDGISKETLKIFATMTTETGNFVNSVITDLPKITHLCDKYNKLLLMALRFKDELDKEVVRNLDSYDLTISLSTVLQSIAVKKHPIDCIVNFSEDFTKQFIDMLDLVSPDIVNTIESFLAEDCYVSHSIFQLTPPDLFFADDGAMNDYPFVSELITEVSNKVIRIIQYFKKEFDIILLSKTSTDKLSDVFDPTKNTAINDKTVITKKYLDVGQKEKIAPFLSQLATNDASIQAKIVADKVGGAFIPCISTNFHSLKESAFPLVLSFSCEFFWIYNLIYHHAAINAQIVGLLGMPTHYYWSFVLKCLVCLYLRLGNVGYFDSTLNILSINIDTTNPSSALYIELQNWYKDNYNPDTVTTIENSTVVADFKKYNKKSIEVTENFIDLILVDNSAKLVTLNDTMVQNLDRIDISDADGNKIFTEANKYATQLLNTTNISNIKKYLIPPATTKLSQCDILKILGLCDFTNQNLSTFFFDRVRSVFLPYQLLYKPTMPANAPEQIVKKIRINIK